MRLFLAFYFILIGCVGMAYAAQAHHLYGACVSGAIGMAGALFLATKNPSRS